MIFYIIKIVENFILDQINLEIFQRGSKENTVDKTSQDSVSLLQFSTLCSQCNEGLS